jgi:hypothetical protein
MSDDFLFDDKCGLWSPGGDSLKCPSFSSVPLEMLPVVKWNNADVGWYSMHRYWMNPVRHVDDKEPSTCNMNLKEYLIARLTNGDLSRFKSFTPPINPSSGKPYKSGNIYEQALKDFIAGGYSAMEEEDFNTANILLTCMERLGLRDELMDCTPRLRIGTTLNKSVDCSATIDLYSVGKGVVQLKLTSNQLFSYVGDSYRWKLIQNGNLLEAALITKIFYATTSLVPPVNFIVAQTKPPYQIKMYRVKQSTIDYYWDIVDSCVDYFFDVSNKDTLMRVDEI